MKNYEVAEPIINSPFEEPSAHYYIRQDHPAEKREGRRPPVVYPPREQNIDWDLSDRTLVKDEQFPGGYRLELVAQLRPKVGEWRDRALRGESVATRTTRELLAYWHRDDREKRLFFAQLEAAETVMFLHEAPRDMTMGVTIPRDEPSDDRKADGFSGFRRLACKLATGAGKTTVMAMVAAWSILNKIADRRNKTYSDAVFVVCPNVTIRSRLQELDPLSGDASLYRTFDIVPPHLMPQLMQGKVAITNWHVLERSTAQDARVVKAGVRETRQEWVYIGKENTTMRGMRYLTLETYERQVALGQIEPVSGTERTNKDGTLKQVKVRRDVFVESDAALVQRVLGRDLGNKENILVINDESHHAYRIDRRAGDDEEEGFEDEATEDDDVKEATVWIDGLDRIHKKRRINFCLDLSATPYFLSNAGRETNRPFPWIVSDFGLIEAIESGLTKIPQFATRDPSGAEIPAYFNIWDWVLGKLTSAEKGGARQSPKPEAILKYAAVPIQMLADDWKKKFDEWRDKGDDPRPPVFIIVCKDTKLAGVIHSWLIGESTGGTSCTIAELRDPRCTIRVDSKVVTETDSEASKSDENRWMRFTLDTAGRSAWPLDRQGRSIYPEGFEELAEKLKKPLEPPGRDVRCIVSVGMLTEGWDCRTVSHIIGLRPFMSQLLCEQVVGRGLRRRAYETAANGLFEEEVSKILGVPFEFIPFKASEGSAAAAKPERRHVYPIPQKRERLEIRFPRVEGYVREIRRRVDLNWDSAPPISIDPTRIPSESELKGLSLTAEGRPTLHGPGKVENLSLELGNKRIQEVVFDMAGLITRRYAGEDHSDIPTPLLFRQLKNIVQKYLETKVEVVPGADLRLVGFEPYFSWVASTIADSLRPDVSQGETPELPVYEQKRGSGSTADVDFWTSKSTCDVLKSHLNCVAADTRTWEQSTAYFIDTHDKVRSFVKNDHLGFAIPYMHESQMHEYYPDFVIRLETEDAHHLILETKGYDPKKESKRAGAMRWIDAINADGKHGLWQYAIAFTPTEARRLIDEAWAKTRGEIQNHVPFEKKMPELEESLDITLIAHEPGEGVWTYGAEHIEMLNEILGADDGEGHSQRAPLLVLSETQQDDLHQAEALYGVHLIAIHEPSRTVVFGVDYVDKLVTESGEEADED